MRAMGATLAGVSRGSVSVQLLPGPSTMQQHGYVHARAVSAIADSAAGYSAQTLMAPDRTVLTTEFKINLLAPALGERLIAVGEVIRAGRTLTVAQARVFAENGERKLVALLTATMIAVPKAETDPFLLASSAGHRLSGHPSQNLGQLLD